MPPEDAQKILKNKQIDESTSGWKYRANLLSDLYPLTTKEKKVCKKCNNINPFFKVDCDKCGFKFAKTRADRGVNIGDRGNQLGFSNNTDNYSVYYWELLQNNNEIFGT